MRKQVLGQVLNRGLREQVFWVGCVTEAGPLQELMSCTVQISSGCCQKSVKAALRTDKSLFFRLSLTDESLN